jgi:hypothetical protein
MLLLRAPRLRFLLPALLFLAAALVAGLLLHHVSGALAAESHPAAPSRTPVIVELFTSEGCSSCPPADGLLGKLQRDQPVASAEVIALEGHVDYWDGLGWHDRFSSAAITARQSSYVRRFQLDSNYTPQMVVDGASQFTGNDSVQALQTIAQAAKSPKPALSIQAVMVSGDHVAGQVRLPQPTPSNVDLYAALVEPMASTQVLHGENGGHTLNHVSVVRNLQRIPVRGAASADFSVVIPKGLTPAGLRMVVFLQRNGPGPILAAAASPLPFPSANPVAGTAHKR